jgi:tRNA nucleotidyltransferase/poly(A) polymerase
VIVVLGPRGAGQIDVATFRQDDAYSDGRRPDSVSFSSPELDAQRRDFTINGLFFDPLAEQVIDYVGGQADLQTHVIRAIGDARARIGEDKLRMLRAVRFAARLGFAIEAETRAAIAEMAPQVTVVSAERIATEMRAMLVHPSRAAAIAMLHDVNLLNVILPELAALADASDAADRNSNWQLTLRTLDALIAPDFPLALAALVHSAEPPLLTSELARRWKLSNQERTLAEWLVAKMPQMFELPTLPWSRQQPLLVHPAIGDLLELFDAWSLARNVDRRPLEHAREKLLLPPEQLNPPLLVGGDDLIAHGVRRGPAFTRLLQAVRDAQLEGQIQNRREALELVDRLIAAENS